MTLVKIGDYYWKSDDGNGVKNFYNPSMGIYLGLNQSRKELSSGNVHNTCGTYWSSNNTYWEAYIYPDIVDIINAGSLIGLTYKSGNRGSTTGTVSTLDVYEYSVTNGNVSGGYTFTGRDGNNYYNGTITITAKTKTDKLFTHWSGDSSSTSSTIRFTNQDVTVTANYKNWEKKKFTLYKNYGDATSDTYEVNPGEIGELPSISWTVQNHRFIGWATSSSGPVVYQDRDEIDNTSGSGGTVKLYAKWEYSAFSITVAKVNAAIGGESVSSVGTLKLYNTTTNQLVATESSGTLSYEGTGDDSTTYRLTCEMPSTSPSSLYNALGVYNSGTSSYDQTYTVTPTSGTVLNLDYVFQKKALYSATIQIFENDVFVPSPTASNCTASITDPASPDENGKYVSGRNLTITGVPKAGYNLTTIAVGGDRYTGITNNTAVVNNLRADSLINCYFTKISYTLRAQVDTASASAITSVKVNGSASHIAYYGDTVTYTAEIASVYGGPVFDGWYDGDTRVSTSTTYTHTVTGNKTLVAKAKVSAIFNIVYNHSTLTSQESCRLFVNGDLYIPGGTNYVTLGNSVTFEMVPGVIQQGGTERWYFDAWFDSDDVSMSYPLSYPRQGTITPTSNISMFVYVTEVVKTNTLTVTLIDDEGEVIEYGSAIATPQGAETSSYASGVYTFEFNGTNRFTLTAAETIVRSGEMLAFDRFAEDDTTLSQNPEYTLTLASDRDITAYYGLAGSRTITLAYGSDNGVIGDRTMGVFSITGTNDPSGVISQDGKSATVSRGKTITIVVTARNGYKFDGWYTTEEKGGTPYITDPTYVLPVRTDRNLYAQFSQDPNAVYEWEGSGDNKNFEWRSKTFTFARPSNMSCVRADTTGYPIETLDVDVFSAPNTAATSTARLVNIASQDSRRLPRLRPERYVQVRIKNDREVDSVVVGTSMTEIAQ